MNKFSFVRSNNGVMKLPPGFRFQPTDEELVFQYLRRKQVFSCQLPPYSSDLIPEINVCNYDPWDLPAGNMEQDRYFFSNKEAKYKNGNRTNRRTSSGYWKATGSDKKIVSSAMKHIVGTRKTLVFYKGKPPHGSRTDWFMHEYSLVINPELISQNQIDQNWVLCHIFYKERSTKKDDHEEGIIQNWKDNTVERNGVYEPKLFDLVMGCNINMGPVSSSSSSSSSSSFVTEVSSSYTDAYHAESSGCNHF